MSKLWITTQSDRLLAELNEEDLIGLSNVELGAKIRQILAGAPNKRSPIWRVIDLDALAAEEMAAYLNPTPAPTQAPTPTPPVIPAVTAKSRPRTKKATR